MDGITIKDYTLSIGKIVGPENIRFVLRIFNGRVCLYLSNQGLVDKLTQANTRVNIGSHSLLLRPLVSKSVRVIISNVCPVIPHSVIEEKLKQYRVNVVSQITFIKAGINDPAYAHIMSFRRQVSK